MNKDLVNDVVQGNALNAQTVAADAPGGAIDTLGFGELGFFVNVGAGTINSTDKAEVQVLESDEAGSGFAEVADYAGATDDKNDTWDRLLDLTGDQNKGFKVVVKGGKRYKKVNVDKSGSFSALMAVGYVLSNAIVLPAEANS